MVVPEGVLEERFLLDLLGVEPSVISFLESLAPVIVTSSSARPRTSKASPVDIRPTIGEPTGDEAFDSESLRLFPTNGVSLATGGRHGGGNSASVGKLPGSGGSLGKTLPHVKGFISS